MNFKNRRHSTAAIGLSPTAFHVEAGGGKGQGKREKARTKSNSFLLKVGSEGYKKRIAGIQEGGIPAIQVWVN
jgi:hypothetical protein